jgi:hypothetical protein
MKMMGFSNNKNHRALFSPHRPSGLNFTMNGKVGKSGLWQKGKGGTNLEIANGI